MSTLGSFQGRETLSSTTPDLSDGRQQRVLQQFHKFPFSSDTAFQQGLSTIFAHESMNQLSYDEQSAVILETKVFYFNSVTHHNITLEDVQAGHTVDANHVPAKSGNECNQTLSGAEQLGEIRTLTFAELKNLIEEGKTGDIPNNKTIPDTLSDGVPSQSTTPLRKKPWEAASQS